MLTALLVALLLLASAAPVQAHRIDEYLQATLLSVARDHVTAAMRLVPGEVIAPSVIEAIDTDRDGAFSEAEQRAYAQRVLGDLSITVDAAAAPAMLVAWRYPTAAQMREGLGEIHIEYTVVLAQTAAARTFRIANRHRNAESVFLVNVLAPNDRAMHILGQTRDATQSVYALDFRQDGAAAPDAGAFAASVPGWWRSTGLVPLFDLGMKHIAEGTDHLLFLLALLLPAPLLATGNRWASSIGARRSLLRVLAIVTAFTVGHSITLTLAAVGGWSLPSRPVEVLIALSILVSAMHALRPIFPGKEAVIAAGFGLVHGLAFAATLDRLGLGLWQRVAGTLAFNLGIEAMQLMVIGMVLPSLLLMSTTRAYRALRLVGGLFAGAASLAWIVERLSGIDTHVDDVVAAVAQHGFAIAVVLLAVALCSRFAFSVPRSAQRAGAHGGRDHFSRPPSTGPTISMAAATPSTRTAALDSPAANRATAMTTAAIENQ